MKYHRLETHRKLYLHNLPLKIEQLYNYIAKISDYSTLSAERLTYYINGTSNGVLSVTLPLIATFIPA